jgi:FkbM family methyltransferase
MLTNYRGMSPIEGALSMMLRHIPIKHGQHRLLDKTKPKAWSQNSQVVQMSYHGCQIVMDIDDLVGWHFLILKSFDPEVSEILCTVGSASEKSVFWDVGANKGACSYAVATSLPNCKIVLIEPQIAFTNLLNHNMSQLAPDRFEVHSVGIGIEEGEFQLAIPASNKGRATLVFDEATNNDPKISVKIKTANQIVESSAYGWPTLVKIDVEGFEPIIFQALMPAILSRTCEVIVFENHPDQVEALKVITDLVIPHGYKMFAIHKTPFTTKLIACAGVMKSATDYAVIRDDVLKISGLRGMLSSS